MLHASNALNAWVVRSGAPDTAKISIFCFPFAGAGASVYRPWANAIPTEMGLCAVQLPGRESRIHEKPFTNMGTLVSMVAKAILPLLDRRFILFGHSMGALVAFEVTRFLRERGHKSPEVLVVSGCRAPQLRRTRPTAHDLPDNELIEKLKEFQGSRPTVLGDTELMRLLLPTIRADFKAAETYLFSPSQPLSCPIVALGGAGDRYVSASEVEAWRSQTTGSFSCHILPGSHFFLLESQSLVIETLVEIVRHCAAATLTGTRGNSCRN